MTDEPSASGKTLALSELLIRLIAKRGPGSPAGRALPGHRQHVLERIGKKLSALPTEDEMNSAIVEDMAAFAPSYDTESLFPPGPLSSWTAEQKMAYAQVRPDPVRKPVTPPPLSDAERVVLKTMAPEEKLRWIEARQNPHLYGRK